MQQSFRPLAYLAFFCVLSIVFTGCGKDNASNYSPPKDALFQALSSSVTGIEFTNEVTDGEDFNVLSYRNFYNGAGVAIADLNGDDLPDLYFTANQGPNQLYLNQGSLDFKVAKNAGGAAGTMAWSTGVTAIDVNDDGKLDLYVCNSGEVDGSKRANELFINQGNNENGEPQFKEMAAVYGLNDDGYSTQAAWFDYDHDGDLDVYLLNNSYLNPDKINPNGENRKIRDHKGGDKLLRNDTGNDHPTFVDASEEAGIYGSRIGFGLGSGLGDVNGDGWTDLYVSNDFWERDYLYINQQDGTFKEELKERIDHLSISSMGSDVADLNNDGYPEIFSTDMLAADNYRLKAATLYDNVTVEGIKASADYHHQILQNCLQLNDGTGNFQEIAHFSKVGATDWSWGALIFDMNNDGMKDIFVANGIYHDIMNLDFADFVGDKEQVKKLVEEKGRFDWRDFVEFLPPNQQANYAFVNQGDLKFSNESAALGLGNPSFSNGAAYGDLDGDGDLDLVVNNVNQPVSIYRNSSEANGNNYLRVKLNGPSGNIGGIGAKVTIAMADGSIQTQEQYPTRGYLSTVDYVQVFGLGKDIATLKSLTIRWPDGKSQQINNVEPNQTITLNYANATDRGPEVKEKVSPLFLAAQDELDIPAEHVEEFFNDFNHEGLLIRPLSNPGPKVVKGDPNGDGLEDFILLGSAGQSDKLYHQQPDGSFKYQPSAMFDATASVESSCGAFFDADGDGDADLLLGAGGNEFARGFTAYALRYYENLNGQLVFNQVLAPNAGGEVSCILPEDIDLDGDIDLFIGGRAVPGNYGLTPGSFLMIREGGQWVNQTTKELGTIGMVTGGTWSDLNGDKRPDLILVGDWMPITIAFTLPGAQISELFQVPNTEGWWTNVTAADLDGDGLEDLVATNWGLNSQFRASKERPLEMYVKDFDGNKKSEPILNWYPPAEDRPYPFASKRNMHGQMPHLRKRTLKYEDYAKADYTTLFTEDERKGAIEYKAKRLESCVIWNDGEGKVTIKPLPWQAQLTNQFAAAATDINNDGKPDLWLGGNMHGLTPQVGRADAGRGALFLNAGNREWTYVDNRKAGISVKGEVRDAQFIDLATGEKALLIGQNNDELLVFKLQRSNIK